MSNTGSRLDVRRYRPLELQVVRIGRPAPLLYLLSELLAEVLAEG